MKSFVFLIVVLVGVCTAQNLMCGNLGQPCQGMGGMNCCPGLNCMASMGNMRTCQRMGGIGGPGGVPSLCGNLGQPCQGMGGMNCCPGLNCMASMGNMRTCQRMGGIGGPGGVPSVCRKDMEICDLSGPPRMRCCNGMSCVHNPQSRVSICRRY